MATKMRRFWCELGCWELEIETAASDDDMESTFLATCCDTGDRLKINGWLVAHLEEIADLEIVR